MVEVGIHIFMAFYGLSVFLETPEHLRKGRRRYIATSFIITFLSALTASLDRAGYFQVLFGSTSPSHWAKLKALNYRQWKSLLSGTVMGILVWIGDALMVYRCYVICVNYWWMAVLQGATSLCAPVLYFIITYRNDLPTENLRVYATAYIFLVVSTNFLVTCLIVFHLLRARRALSKLLPSKDMRLYTGVVAILIESALPLSIFGIIAAALVVGASASTPQFSEGRRVCYYLFTGLFYTFCTLSPHMIIFRVTTGRSFVKFPSPKDAVLSNPIAFAHQTAKSSFLQSSINTRQICRNPEPDVERLGGDSIGAIPLGSTTQTSRVIQGATEEREEVGGEKKNI
ncbi:hypothetical protein EST38_g10235 [Candolleomyces aberdarensis]|uniref:G protein-coupled receptor n=1 Tax=Candolleomyces aberdarensis TaxID=2316362 RepID=A0A4Q2D7X0_9AGAR|nr:hypothetical protein EST38_g10235 [Candolleomyces aberdarensis]